MYSAYTVLTMMITKTFRLDHEVADRITKMAEERACGQGKLLEMAINALTANGQSASESESRIGDAGDEIQ